MNRWPPLFVFVKTTELINSFVDVETSNIKSLSVVRFVIYINLHAYDGTFVDGHS